MHPQLLVQTDYSLYLLRQLATLLELLQKEGIDILNNDNSQDKCWQGVIEIAIQDNGENERRYEWDIICSFHNEASIADKSASTSCRILYAQSIFWHYSFEERLPMDAWLAWSWSGQHQERMGKFGREIITTMPEMHTRSLRLWPALKLKWTQMSSRHGIENLLRSHSKQFQRPNTKLMQWSISILKVEIGPMVRSRAIFMLLIGIETTPEPTC